MMIGRCPKCQTEYPLQVVGLNCGRCLIDANRVVPIVLAPPAPVILKIPRPAAAPAKRPA